MLWIEMGPNILDVDSKEEKDTWRPVLEFSFSFIILIRWKPLKESVAFLFVFIQTSPKPFGFGLVCYANCWEQESGLGNSSRPAYTTEVRIHFSMTILHPLSIFSPHQFHRSYSAASPYISLDGSHFHRIDTILPPSCCCWCCCLYELPDSLTNKSV